MAERDPSVLEIERNRLLHNQIAGKYHRIHGDIFNSHEQTRINGLISRIRGAFAASETPLALDYGCGSGNMTHHLRSLGFRVVSADISDRFIELMAEKYPGDSLVVPHLLSGDPSRDLQEYRFDAICIYSVLHHLPDYLLVLRALMKLLRPGGYLYLDHEACDSFWSNDPKYTELQRRTRIHKLRANWTSLLTWRWYLTRYRMLKDPRFQPEGDLHVWHDDHIEWERIRSVAAGAGLEEIHSQDYLNYRPYYPPETFAAYAGVTADMHCSIFRKSRDR